MTRKVFLVLLALVLVFSMGLVACGAVGEQEEEEEEEEQEIQTWHDLHAIGNNLDGTYFLGNDLDSTTPGYQELASKTANAGKGWEPIGTFAERFTGIFDGGGHSISGLYIGRPAEDDVGLFGYVEEGIIKNIGLLEVDVTGGNQTGALVGYNWGGTVESDPTRPYSTYSTGTVTGNDKVGGLVGYNWGGIVSLSQSSADIAHTSDEAWRAGGLVGSNWGDVFLCLYSGSVIGDREVGGLVGLNGDLVPGGIGGRVVSCYGEYTVTGNWFVGGAAGVNLGRLDNVALNFSVNGRPVNGGSFTALDTDAPMNGHSADIAPQGSYVGGLVGLNEGAVNNCVTVGSVTGYQYVGGLVGYNDPDGVIGSSFAATGVEGSLDSGGLIGYNNAVGAVTDSFWDSGASDTTTGVGAGDATGITSKSSQEMKDINSYIQAGWDICAVAPGESNTACTWNMVPGETYPYLSGKQPVQYSLTISSTEGGEVTTPGRGTFTYAEGTVVNLAAEAEEGYHFVNWTGDVSTIADVNARATSITMNSNYIITANFAVDIYFQADAVASLDGPVTLPPEQRNACVMLQVMTNMIAGSVRVDLPGGMSVLLAGFTDVFTPGVDWTSLFRFGACEPGMPVAGGEYAFTGLDVRGEPLAGATSTDIWVGVEPPDPPTNVRAEVTEDGILVSWDEVPTIPDSFEPTAQPQLGDYRLEIYAIETGEVIYGAWGMSVSSHLIPQDRASFIEARDWGLSLDEMKDGMYYVRTRVASMAPAGSLGKGLEYFNTDPGQDIVFTIQDGGITIG